MSDLLAIVNDTDTDTAADEALLAEIARRHPDRVTVLVEDGHTATAGDESQDAELVRDRLACLLTAIERRTGAVVVGLAGSPDQLRGWRFDRVVGGHAPRPA